MQIFVIANSENIATGIYILYYLMS